MAVLHRFYCISKSMLGLKLDTSGDRLSLSVTVPGTPDRDIIAQSLQLEWHQVDQVIRKSDSCTPDKDMRDFTLR